LTRLTIRAALQFAQYAVTVHRRRGAADIWFVHTRIPDGLVTKNGPFTRPVARKAQRVDRVFVSLLALGVAPAEASRLARKAIAERNGEWRRMVMDVFSNGDVK
jgi:hypothetical protein